MAATNFKEAGQPGSVVERKKRGEVESVQNKYPRKILFVSTKAVLLSNILPEGFSCSRVSGQQLTHVFIRAKRVCNCYIPKKKSARVRVCSTNLRFSVEKNVLVLVWGTYYVPHTYACTWYQRALRCQLRGRPFHPWAGRLRFSGEAHPGPATLTQSSSFSCGAGLQSESRLLLCCAPVTRDHATHVYSSVHACC